MTEPQGQGDSPASGGGYETSPEAVRDLLRGAPGRVLLVDCRTEQERRIASITPSVHVPMGEIPARLDELESYESERVIVYCHHGVRSLQVVDFLRRHGVEQAQSMAGGIDRWSREIDPAVPRY